MNESTIPQYETYFKVIGEGEPLIFIHGVGLDHTMWQYQLDYFSNYYKVYAYDMLGHGRSEKPNQEEYKLEDFTNQLNRFMEIEQIESAHLVGFSMGGMVAQSFSVSFPEKVKTLTVASGVANRSKVERKSILDRVKQVEKEGENTTIEAAVERWFSQEYQKESMNVVNEIKERLEKNDVKSYLNAYRLFATADQEIWDKLKQIQVPTFIITGKNDVGSNPRMAKKMQRRIPNSELCIVPNVKHMLPIEEKRIFNRHIQEFLQRHRSEGKRGG